MREKCVARSPAHEGEDPPRSRTPSTPGRGTTSESLVVRSPNPGVRLEVRETANAALEALGHMVGSLVVHAPARILQLLARVVFEVSGRSTGHASAPDAKAAVRERQARVRAAPYHLGVLLNGVAGALRRRRRGGCWVLGACMHRCLSARACCGLRVSVIWVERDTTQTFLNAAIGGSQPRKGAPRDMLLRPTQQQS